MADVMLKIGDIRFGMSGPAYDEFTHEINADWAAQGRINRRPALQFTGVGSETITLSGTIYGMFAPGGTPLGIGQLKQIENALLSPGPQLVIDGTGRRYGYFIIRSLRESRSRHITNGAPQKQGFTIVLERYGEDMLRDDAILGEGNTDLGNISAIRSNAAMAT